MSYYEMYLYLALLGSGLFLMKLALMIIGNDHLDVGAPDEAFEAFSLQSLFAFLMGFGWSGLALQYEFEVAPLYAFAGAFCFGLGSGCLSSFLIYLTRKLNHATPESMPQVGSIGKVYVNVSPHSLGQVQLVVGGSVRMVDATTTSLEALPAFSQIKVVKVNSKNLVTVDKI